MISKNSWENRLECLWQRVRRGLGRGVEVCRYAGTRQPTTPFFLVTCQRNAGEHALRCLDSVHRQDYPRTGYRHLFIDDASTDDTIVQVENWLAAHPDHRVELIKNPQRVGGTANTLKGFSAAPSGCVVVELNGDDWLPDPGVLDFFNRVYGDEEVWMTYNTLCYPDGGVPHWARPYPRKVVRSNSYRDYPDWSSSHLHTFRCQLFDHLRPETFIDPVTGALWESADDQAIYLAMLELSGRHARHLNRITYVYNFWEQSHSHADNHQSQQRALRIRQGGKYAPLERL